MYILGAWKTRTATSFVHTLRNRHPRQPTSAPLLMPLREALRRDDCLTEAQVPGTGLIAVVLRRW